jgi:predicted RNase H-like nuclease (RuvC/YqgF family)
MSNDLIIALISAIGALASSKGITELYKFLTIALKARTEKNYQDSEDLKAEKKTKIEYLEERIDKLEKENKEEKRRVQEKEEEINKLTMLVMQSVVLLQESLVPRANKTIIRSKTDEIIKELELLKEVTYQNNHNRK